jgi:hypothetical protein
MILQITIKGSVVHINIGNGLALEKCVDTKKNPLPPMHALSKFPRKQFSLFLSDVRTRTSMIGTGNAHCTNMMASTNAKTFTSNSREKF